MAKENSTRQKEWRAKQAAKNRLNIFINDEAKGALDNLVRTKFTNQSHEIESALIAANNKLLSNGNEPAISTGIVNLAILYAEYVMEKPQTMFARDFAIDLLECINYHGDLTVDAQRRNVALNKLKNARHTK